jgi:acyl carrier protein
MSVGMIGRAPEVQVARGALLSCYTASIALLMERVGLDHEIAFGSQLYLAIDVSELDKGSLAFMHYHTPLRGPGATNYFPLERRAALHADEALAGIASESASSGAAVVVGDGYRLPWHIDYCRRHVSHWFVVDQIERESVHVVDAFQALTAAGEQRPFSGWMPWRDIATFWEPPFWRSPVALARERYALGDREALDAIVRPGYHWFALDGSTGPGSLDSDSLRRRLAETYAFHRDEMRHPQLSSTAWVCGPNAIRLLAEFVEPRLDDAGFYEMQDDIWVAARNRQLFALVLDRIGSATASPPLRALAAWFRAEVAATWISLVRVLEYCEQSVRRGRAARTLPVDLLRQAADLEDEFLDQLDEVLRSGKTLSGSRGAPLAVAAPVADSAARPPARAMTHRTADEAIVAGIWAEVLGVESVGVADDFLALGGNSLAFVRILIRIHDSFGVDLPLFGSLRMPTVAALVDLIEIVRWVNPGGAPATTGVEFEELVL